MKQSLILVLCFLPLAIIYVVMKVAVWLTSIQSEVTYVREESKRPHGPYLDNPYGDIDEEDEDN